MTTGNKQKESENVFPDDEVLRHSETPVPVIPLLPDDPEMIPYVLCYLEKGARSYLDALQESLSLVMQGVATPENLQRIAQLLKEAKGKSLAMFADRVRQLEE